MAFTRFPAGRYAKNGETSGEAFRERFLVSPLLAGEQILVELDGTVGYGSSFLEEAFGGAVRRTRLKPSQILGHLQLKSSDPSLVEEVTEYITDAGRESA
ncbi:MAG: STAS-like domain-containing protein [Burkholderiales bacterium]